MSVLKHAESFRDLLVYQKARELQREVFLISRAFPKDERFSLSDQIRRSSRSIGANIAEAWAKRRYEAHFVSKLTDADGEQYETQHCASPPSNTWPVQPTTNSDRSPPTVHCSLLTVHC
jgi:23S rRNA-intervening sequence protein